jgi:hypothetical protein
MTLIQIGIPTLVHRTTSQATWRSSQFVTSKDNDQIHTASGAGMKISHIGHTIVPTSSRNLYLNNALHVPDAAKNLVSVHRLTRDNFAFLEFHPDYFLIKDQATKNTILRGRCHRGLYPLPPTRPVKRVFEVVKPTFSRWHSRLGHPSSPIVKGGS